MTVNTQAASAGSAADERIKQLANPKAQIKTDKAVVDVLDRAKPIQSAQAAPEEDWKKRFTGYKASTDSTIHKLRQRANQFDLTQTENATLRQQLADAQAAIPTTKEDMLNLFSKEEADGVDKFVDVKLKGLQDEVNRLQAVVADDERDKANTIAQHLHESIVDTVKASVPNYQTIDTSPAFKRWIQEPDKFGNLRFDMLVKAKQENPPDIARIISFYTEFASTQKKAGVKPSAKRTTMQELMQTPKSTPSGGNPKGAPRSLNKVWNTATSSEFYKNKALGKYTPEEAQALEEDLYRSLKKH